MDKGQHVVMFRSRRALFYKDMDKYVVCQRGYMSPILPGRTLEMNTVGEKSENQHFIKTKCNQIGSVCVCGVSVALTLSDTLKNSIKVINQTPENG